MKYFLKEYKHCPLCASKLVWKNEFLECLSCGHRIFDNSKPAANIFLENDKNEILFTVRKIDPYKGWLDFPGGFVQSGESLEETARREAKEEIGVDVEIGKYIGSYPVEYDYKGLMYKLVAAFFQARGDLSKIKVGDDVSAFEFVPKSKIHKVKISFPEVHTVALKDYLKIFPDRS